MNGIPDAAVEAAAAKLPAIWSASPAYRANLALALEAAAPHMLAECWDASAKATADYELEYRVSFDFGDDLPEVPANPYRPTP